MMDRTDERAFAAATGHFWLPCPLCGDGFGGHEWGIGHVIPTSATGSQAICPTCAHDLGQAVASVCADYGHDLMGVEVIHNGDGRVVGWRETNGPADVTWCARCLAHDKAVRPAVRGPGSGGG